MNADTKRQSDPRVANLAIPVGIEFTDDQKRNADLQFKRVRRPATGGKSHKISTVSTYERQKLWQR